jgi:hypothetical protein
MNSTLAPVGDEPLGKHLAIGVEQPRSVGSSLGVAAEDAPEIRPLSWARAARPDGTIYPSRGSGAAKQVRDHFSGALMVARGELQPLGVLVLDAENDRQLGVGVADVGCT